jgi:CBS domain-containing protein
MSVGNICNREVVIARRDDSIVEIARLMRRHHVGSVVICEERHGHNKAVGIVTDRDLVVEVMATSVDEGEVSAGDIMSYELLTAREQDGLWEVMQRMRARGVRRVPVVDKDGGLLGILTADDIIELLAGELGDFAQLIVREQRREREVREKP